MDERPLLAITMGDPAGIGPEITAKTLGERHLYALSRPVVIGTVWAMQDAAELAARVAGKTPLRVRRIESPDQATGAYGTIEVLEPYALRREDLRLGEVSAAGGKASVEYIEEAARLALAGEIAAIATGPINKEGVHLAGYAQDIGHQEILARMTGASVTATMLIAGTLRVAHLSTHKALHIAVDYVRRENVLEKLELTHRCMEEWGIPKPRIAVAGLNPHGGEGGLLGREEIHEIAPAVVESRERGIDARGPYPADSVFHRAVRGEFDAVLAMYHDQGHIAIKMHNFEESTTVTMGIPIIRTSVDHGTAYDIVGKGIAHHISLVRAVEAAVQIASRKLAAGLGTGRI